MITFGADTTPALADLDANFAELLQGLTELLGSSNIVITPGVDVNGNPTATFSLAATISPQVVDATSLLKGKGITSIQDAASGYIGEYIQSVLASASAVSLTSDTTATVVSMSLPAGDWDIKGVVGFTGTATSVTYAAGGISKTTALPSEEYQASWLGRSGPMTVNPIFTVPERRENSDATATIRLTARANFSGGTCSAFGKISARRVR